MNKKLFIIILLFFILLVGCSENNSEYPNDDNKNTNTTDIPTQPILFDKINDFVNFLVLKDVEKYQIEDRNVYIESINILTSYGYLIVPKLMSAKQVYSITFFPKTINEDVGLGFWYEYCDELYQVIIYEFDKNIINEIDIVDINDYKKERFNLNQKTDNVIEYTINGISMKLVISEFGQDDNKKNVISFSPIKNKYFEIRSSANKDNILSFINLLDYEIIEL